MYSIRSDNSLTKFRLYFSVSVIYFMFKNFTRGQALPVTVISGLNMQSMDARNFSTGNARLLQKKTTSSGLRFLFVLSQCCIQEISRTCICLRNRLYV